MLNVVISEEQFYKSKEVFEQAEGMRFICCAPDEDVLAECVTEHSASCVVVGIEKYTQRLYDVLPEGGLIARFGVGHDGIDKSKAQQRGIFCTNTPGVLDQSVAECAAGLMLSAARQLCSSSSHTLNGKWHPQTGIELSGKTLAIIGCGHIGTKLAAIARNGFGMRVHGNDLYPPQVPQAYDFFTSDFENAVKDADVVSLHIPALAATEKFINSARLKALKPGAILLNTARGAVIDENALYDALRCGSLGCAALDVYQNEPYKPVCDDRDLRTLPNIIMTPHIGSNTFTTCRAMAESVLQNIRYWEKGDQSNMNLVRE